MMPGGIVFYTFALNTIEMVENRIVGSGTLVALPDLEQFQITCFARYEADAADLPVNPEVLLNLFPAV